MNIRVERYVNRTLEELKKILKGPIPEEQMETHTKTVNYIILELELLLMDDSLNQHSGVVMSDRNSDIYKSVFYKALSDNSDKIIGHRSSKIVNNLCRLAAYDAIGCNIILPDVDELLKENGIKIIEEKLA